MTERGDALVAASKLVVYIEGLAMEQGGVTTVETMIVGPGSPNCVPDKAQFTVDLRHHSSIQADLIETRIGGRMKSLEADDHRLRFSITRNWHSPAVTFDNKATDCLTSAASSLVGPEKVGRMISFAGHDSAMTALKVPTAMLIVPSFHGISHALAEYTSKEQCGTGVQILMDAVLAYDQHLATMCAL